MKLRIQDDSLRFRLTRREVDALGRGLAVERTVHFRGGRTLRYVVAPETGAPGPQAVFDGDAVRVTVPGEGLKAWAASEEAGIEGNDGSLRILVEKDFQCLHRDTASEPDAFPNPLRS